MDFDIQGISKLTKTIISMEVRYKIKKQCKYIMKSGMFEVDFYLKQYPNLNNLEIDPILHYCLYGWKDGKNPNKEFDTKAYLESNPDVAMAGINPFYHYLTHGKAEGRPKKLISYDLGNEIEYKDNFSSDVTTNPDNSTVLNNATSLYHYIKFNNNNLDQNINEEIVINNSKEEHGYVAPEEQEALDLMEGCEYFDTKFYLESYPDVAEANMSPSLHYLLHGWKEGRNPSQAFITEQYLEANEDVRKEGINPLYHYLKYGKEEGRRLKKKIKAKIIKGLTEDQKEAIELIRDSGYFDEENYLNTNKDIAKTGVDPIEHYHLYGWREGRDPSKAFKIEVYFMYNPDVKQAELDPLLHYITKGYMEGRVISKKNYIEPIFSNYKKKKLENIQQKPLISVMIPVYNVAPYLLEETIASVKNQWYKNWEICIVDDASTKEDTVEYLKNLSDTNIKVKLLSENGHISKTSNEALKMTKGEYVLLMDNDDTLTVDALFEVVKKINEGYDFIYSDEDKIDLDGNYISPYYKPGYAPDMLLSRNYFNHLTVLRKSLVEELGGFEVGLEGSQDHDLYLKVVEKTDKIAHISKVLYHWRQVEGSTALEYSDKSYAWEAGKQAIENALLRRGEKGRVEAGEISGSFRVSYEIVSNPLVSIIIPFKDAPELLKMCIESIYAKNTYSNIEVIGISNNSESKETFEMMADLESKYKEVKFYEYNVPFNYSKINNYGVKELSKGEHILLMNNDIEIISDGFIEELLMHSQREKTGVVGAKLYYPNDTIQHAGVIIGMGGVAGHAFKHMPREQACYYGEDRIIKNYSAVTAALLMVSKSKYLEVEGLNEEDLKVAFNDVDFCLRILEKGYYNVYTPYVEAYHYESISRGHEDNPEKQARFQSEVMYMKKRHGKIIGNGDQFYNPNLCLDRESHFLKQGLLKL